MSSMLILRTTTELANTARQETRERMEHYDDQQPADQAAELAR